MNVTTGCEVVEQLKQLCYLGSAISDDRTGDVEIKSRDNHGQVNHRKETKAKIESAKI